MEYDIGENISSGDFEPTRDASMEYLVHEIAFLIFSIFGICADVFILLVIVRFKDMRTKEMIFFANWAITDLLALIVAPTAYRILTIIINIDLTNSFVCNSIEAATTLHVTEILFAILLVVDWFLRAHFEKTSEKFRNWYKGLIIAVWLFGIGLLALVIVDCHGVLPFATPTATFFLIVFYVALSATVVISHLSRLVKKFWLKRPVEHSPLILNLATGFAAGWFWAFLILFLVRYGSNFVYTVVQCLVFSGGIVSFAILYLCHEKFKSHVLQVIRCHRETSEPLHFNNPIVINRNGKNDCQISFDSATVQLMQDQ